MIFQFARKINQTSLISHEFLPENAGILHNNCPKNIFSEFFWEGAARASPPPVSYAYGVDSGLHKDPKAK